MASLTGKEFTCKTMATDTWDFGIKIRNMVKEKKTARMGRCIMVRESCRI
jgi:hypothetical protein